RAWTVAWVQVREYGGGVTVPIWVPKRIEGIAERAQLEVRGHYYRWFAYDTLDGGRRRVPLFVASDLHPYVLETDAAMRTIGLWLGGVAIAGLGLLIWSQRRAARDDVRHAREMDARRRRRRERLALAGRDSPPSP